MKPIATSLLALLCACSLSAVAQNVDRAVALKEAVEAERAFAKTSELKGTRDAFLEFVADDGILFRPTAVNGKQWLLDHPTPPAASGKRPFLKWQPIFADVAASGDMAYTTGPWEFRPDIKDEKAVAFGHFVTVWKKQADGAWKFVIDLGISHPSAVSVPASWEPQPSNSASRAKATHSAGQKGREALLKLDQKFSSTSQTEGAEKALLMFAEKEIRLYRKGNLPWLGRQNAVLGLPVKSETWTWTPAFSDVSKAGDLGYTYGSYEVSDEAKKLIDKGNYLRIWRRHGGAWMVVVDVADPLPLDAKE